MTNPLHDGGELPGKGAIHLGADILRRVDIFRPGEAIMANEVLHVDVRDAHAHEFFEIACVIEGSGEHHYGTRIQPIKAGDVMLINPYIPHGYIATGKALHICNVTFTEGAVQAHLDHEEVAWAFSLFLRLEEAPLLVGAGERQASSSVTILDLMREMAAEYFARKPGYNGALQGLLLTLLVRLWRESQAVYPLVDSDENRVWQGLFPVFRRMYQEGGANLTVRELADEAGWSVDHFSRMFKQATGETVQRYMRLIRMRRAASLLLTTTKSLDEIASLVGYTDTKSLRRAFSECFGVSPSTYRAQARAVF